MKLKLELEGDGKQHSYQPGEKVRGRVIIEKRNGASYDEITAVEITLQGVLKIRTSKDVVPTRTTHPLFSKSQHVSPKSSHAGTPCDAFFEFTIPPTHKCHTTTTLQDASSPTSCQLPPSLNISMTGLRARTEYTLTATVKRSGISRQTKAVKTALRICSMPPTSSPSNSVTVSLPAEKLFPGVYGNENDGLTVTFPRSGWLPQYSPALRMDISLPQTTITRGIPSPLNITINSPKELLCLDQLFVHSLVVRLRSKVSTAPHLSSIGTPRQASQVRQCFSLQGLIRLNKESVELEPGPWGGLVVMNAYPSCESCVRVAHVLEVTASLSRGVTGELQYLKGSIDVTLVEAPPEYTPAYEMPTVALSSRDE